MIQCIVCEDWYHGRHLGLGAGPPEDSSYAEMICLHCVAKYPILNHYQGLQKTGVLNFPYYICCSSLSELDLDLYPHLHPDLHFQLVLDLDIDLDLDLDFDLDLDLDLDLHPDLDLDLHHLHLHLYFLFIWTLSVFWSWSCFFSWVCFKLFLLPFKQTINNT